MGLFNFVTGFVAGVYAGMFLAQNYEIPKVSDPVTMMDKVKRLAEDYKKKEDWDYIYWVTLNCNSEKLFTKVYLLEFKIGLEVWQLVKIIVCAAPLEKCSSDRDKETYLYKIIET